MTSSSIIWALRCWGGSAPPVAAATAAPRRSASAPPKPTAPPLAEESHLADLRQLTFGGENAEAYWSFDGTQLSSSRDERWRAAIGSSACTAGRQRPPSLDAGVERQGRDDLLVLPARRSGASSTRRRTSAATRARRSRITARATSGRSTTVRHLHAPKADGTDVARLTDTPGYDAEGTVCAKDGSIVFTSVRDGDIELYRMDADGKNVKRLTNTPGYDGGAFFNADCSKIVWRASRPKPGKELDDYKRCSRRGLVRPSKLELYVANADGTEAQQITYLDAASFAPFWHPVAEAHPLLVELRRSRRAASSTSGRSTSTARTSSASRTRRGFDGFPMFSPDGKLPRVLVEPRDAPEGSTTPTSSSRAGWTRRAKRAIGSARRSRSMTDIRWLADPAREGRGIGTPGLEPSGEYIEKRFKELGLAPAGDDERVTARRSR